MFTPDELERIPKKLEGVVSELENRIMSDIIERIRQNMSISRTTDYLINKLYQLGVSKKYIKEQIQSVLQFSETEVKLLYEEILPEGYARDEALYKQISKDFIAYKDNAELQQLVSSVQAQTKGELTNITNSLGFAVKINGKTILTPLSEYYQRTLDKGITEIATGATDYNTVLRKTVQEMTNSGLRTVDYASGHSNRVEVAVRRAVMTGFTQVTHKISDRNAEQLETDYFEVSWHATARPSHQLFQGRVYPRAELISICGLGTVQGLGGINCYHDYYPFIHGISKRLYTDEELDKMNAKENELKEYNGRYYTTYQASQEQRRLETLMRKQRQDIKLLKKGEANEDEVIAAKSRYRSTMAQYNDFSKKMGLPQQKERIYIDNLGRVI